MKEFYTLEKLNKTINYYEEVFAFLAKAKKSLEDFEALNHIEQNEFKEKYYPLIAKYEPDVLANGLVISKAGCLEKDFLAAFGFDSDDPAEKLAFKADMFAIIQEFRKDLQAELSQAENLEKLAMDNLLKKYENLSIE